MRKLILVTAAVLVAVIFFLLATLPPQPVALSLEGVDPDLVRRTVRGAYHIHTTRSDGAEGKGAVAAAAARAGLNFAIFTDHGDGTREPDAPAYINGVLCIDGVEISTNGGHYVALDMPAAPYPLGGEAAAVVEDVKRLGGFGIAAHPDSSKSDLAWTDWDAPIDGLEWISGDSEWRDESKARLARVLFDYRLRPAPALASMLDRPDATLARWTALGRTRPVVALAAADAHGDIGSREEDGRWALIGGPSYEASFRTFANRVILERPFTGDADGDARLLLDAIRRGRVYTVIDAIAGPAIIDVQARGVSTDGEVGAALTIGDRALIVPKASFHVQVSGDFGRPLRRIAGSPGQWVAPTGRQEPLAQGGHFFEVPAPSAPGQPPVPWILTNAIYFLPRAEPPPPAPIIDGEALPAEWRSESDGRSSAAIEATADGVGLRYQLSQGARASQFVALATDLQQHPLPSYDRILFRGRASKPMRISVQLRFPPNDRRWVKSVYLSPEEREIVVRVGDMVSAEPAGGPMPAASTARSLLFVVDLVNAKPGDGGAFTINAVRIAPR